MKEQVAFQKLLQKKYEELRFENPSLSRRAFSKSLGLSPGSISEIFNGQRKVSLKLAKRISERLGLDPESRAELFGIFEKYSKKPRRKRAKSLKAPEPEYLRLSADQFRVSLIQEDENGNLVSSDLDPCTPDDVSNGSIRLAHFELLLKARTALETLPVQERDFTAFMLNLSPSQLPQVKERIRKFQNDLAARLNFAILIPMVGFP